MRMKSLYLTVILAISSYTIGIACSCVYIPTFCETITYIHGVIDTGYVIVHARVEDKSSSEMHVRVLTILFGTPNGSVLTIPQGYGADCRQNVEIFDQDSEYIFALYGRSDQGTICQSVESTI